MILWVYNIFINDFPKFDILPFEMIFNSKYDIYTDYNFWVMMSEGRLQMSAVGIFEAIGFCDAEDERSVWHGIGFNF